jgi:hypothetical protein
MGELVDRIGLRMLVDGDGLADNFKNNSLYFYDKYQKSDNGVKSINVSDILPGSFYHFHYLDDSNWMKWSPVFVTNYKKIGNQIIIFGVNFNFIPLEVRAFLFDNFMKEEDFEKDQPLPVTYEGMYAELIKYGFEYALVEYNALQIKFVHRISMDMVPRFLIAGHPKNKYDPAKLFDIWKVKIKDKDKRNQEIMKSTIDEFYDTRGEINEKYVLLKGHIQRIQNNMKKYGNR